MHKYEKEFHYTQKQGTDVQYHLVPEKVIKE